MGLSSPNRCRKNTFSDLCQHVCITSLFHFHTFHFFIKRVLFHGWLTKLVYYCSLAINVHCKFLENHCLIAVP
jgi:hypothetical protein